uniref:C3H1-type domain-containing protein n=1 Tax=Alexandrium monilatum TaxID=311494 RepID=A0A7S4Q5Z4_9DINO
MHATRGRGGDTARMRGRGGPSSERGDHAGAGGQEEATCQPQVAEDWSRQSTEVYAGWSRQSSAWSTQQAFSESLTGTFSRQGTELPADEVQEALQRQLSAQSSSGLGSASTAGAARSRDVPSTPSHQAIATGSGQASDDHAGSTRGVGVGHLPSESSRHPGESTSGAWRHQPSEGVGRWGAGARSGEPQGGSAPVEGEAQHQQAGRGSPGVGQRSGPWGADRRPQAGRGAGRWAGQGGRGLGPRAGRGGGVPPPPHFYGGGGALGAPVGRREPADSQETIFWKTKLCRFHMIGQCRRGSACKFAHGRNELCPAPDLQYTKFCPSILRGQPCLAWDSCTFAHSLEQLRTYSSQARGTGSPDAGPEGQEPEETHPGAASSAAAPAEGSRPTGRWKTRIEELLRRSRRPPWEAGAPEGPTSSCRSTTPAAATAPTVDMPPVAGLEDPLPRSFHGAPPETTAAETSIGSQSCSAPVAVVGPAPGTPAATPEESTEALRGAQGEEDAEALPPWLPGLSRRFASEPSVPHMMSVRVQNTFISVEESDAGSSHSPPPARRASSAPARFHGRASPR